MNVENGTVAAQFLFWEYLFQIFNIGSLHCSVLHCNGNSAYIFLFWELHGLSPNFHIHVSVSDLYIYSQDRSVYFLQQKRETHRGNIISSQTHECGNWDWDPDIPFLGIFVSNFRHFVFAVYLQPTSIQIIHIFRRPLLVAHAVLLSLVFIIQLASIYTTSELRSGLEHHILNQVKLRCWQEEQGWWFDDTN
jgi:hypothetical protein